MGLVAPLRSADVDFIDIHFKTSLFDVTYNIYGKHINSIWLCGEITSADYEKELFTLDDNSGRILQIKFNNTFLIHKLVGTKKIEVGCLVSVICGISHIIVEQDALLCLKLIRLAFVTREELKYWPFKVKQWRIESNG